MNYDKPKRKPSGYLAIVALLAICAILSAQTVPVLSVNYSGTIAVTSTFQVIQAQANNRQGCVIQNNGTHPMYIFYGPIGSANIATSGVLAAGGSSNCNVAGNLVIRDAISIAGTASDAYFAQFQ